MTDQKGKPNDKDYWRGQVDADLKDINKKVDKILSILDENGNPGLISQVRRLSEWKRKIEKITYAVGLVIILDVIVRILNSSLAEEIFHNTP